VPAEVESSPFVTTLFGGQMVLHPNGNYLYDGAFGVHALSVDTTTGKLDELAGSPHPGAASDNNAADIAFDPLGQYLYASSGTGTVTAYKIDAATGAFGDVPMSPVDAMPLPYALAVDPTGRFVYVGNDDVNQVSVFSIERTSGSLTAITGPPIVEHGAQPEIVILAP
jgi:6-phosphogluconolactonase (cycloisomerase 2 family)